jgi:hypothetical protein
MGNGIDSATEEIKNLQARVESLHRQINPPPPVKEPTPEERINAAFVAQQAKFRKEIGINLEALGRCAARVQLIKCRGRGGDFPSWDKLEEQRVNLKKERVHYDGLKKETFEIMNQLSEGDEANSYFKNTANRYLGTVKKIIEEDEL